jgi:hypothetical protein
MILSELRGNDDRELVDEALRTIRSIAEAAAARTEATGGPAWRLFAQPFLAHCRAVLVPSTTTTAASSAGASGVVAGAKDVLPALLLSYRIKGKEMKGTNTNYRFNLA